MKVLLIDVYNYNKGGAETVCFNTGDMLEQNGHEVTYFTLKWKQNRPSKFEKYFPESKDTRKGVFRQVINLRNYFYYPDAARKIEQLIIDEKPDIAHIHLLWGQISPSIFTILKKYNIPIVFTIHDYRIVCPAYSFRNGKDEVCEKCQGKHFYRCVTNRCTKGSYFLSIFMAAEQYYRNKFFNPAKYIDGLLYVSNFAKGKHEKYMPALKELPNIVLHNFSVSISEHRIPLKELNSTCKCNRILINNLFKFFVWREVSKSFTMSIIEFTLNPLNLFVGYFTKVLTLWDILPDKPVGVFIGTTFP